MHICLLLVCIKDKLVLLLDKTGDVPQATRPNFIDSQNFYFHYKLFCIKAVHLSELKLPSIMPQMNVRHTFEKVAPMQQSFEEFSEKQRRVELKFVGNFVAKTLLFKSANQFSFEEPYMTHYSLK